MSKKKIKVLIVLFCLFIILVSLVLLNKTSIIDQKIYQLIFSIRTDTLDQYFIYITRFGNYSMILVIVIIFILIFRNKYGIILGASACTSVIVNNIIKKIVGRKRPVGLKLISQGGNSFPSGHAMISICVYGYLLYLVQKKIKNKYLKLVLSLALITLILSIGISRIYVGVHYPTDVIAGYLMDSIIVILLIEISNKIYRRG